MIFYFIRHAPTAANFTGSMVNGYDNADILSMEKPADLSALATALSGRSETTEVDAHRLLTRDGRMAMGDDL